MCMRQTPKGRNCTKGKQIKVVPTKRSILTVNKILPSKMGQFTESTIMTKSHHPLKCPPHHSNVLRCIWLRNLVPMFQCRLISLGHPSKQASKHPHNHAWQDYWGGGEGLGITRKKKTGSSVAKNKMKNCLPLSKKASMN